MRGSKKTHSPNLSTEEQNTALSPTRCWHTSTKLGGPIFLGRKEARAITTASVQACWCQWEYVWLVAYKDQADGRNCLKSPCRKKKMPCKHEALLEAEHPWGPALCGDTRGSPVISPCSCEQRQLNAGTAPSSPSLSLLSPSGGHL